MSLYETKEDLKRKKENEYRRRMEEEALKASKAKKKSFFDTMKDKFIRQDKTVSYVLFLSSRHNV